MLIFLPKSGRAIALPTLPFATPIIGTGVKFHCLIYLGGCFNSVCQIVEWYYVCVCVFVCVCVCVCISCSLLFMQVESGGTVLSTNWEEVGTKKVEMKPPDGMEFKKYEI